MAAALNREELLQLLRARLDSLLVDSPRNATAPSLASPECPEAVVLGEIWRAGVILSECLRRPLDEDKYGTAESKESAATRSDVPLATELSAEARRHCQDLVWPQSTELAQLLENVCGLLERPPPAAESGRSVLPTWKEDVRNYFLEREVPTGEMLRKNVEWSESCWLALRSANSLQLPNWATALAELFRPRAVSAISLAMQLREWPTAIALRGQYLATWRLLRSKQSKGAFESRPFEPSRWWGELGRELARRHGGSRGATRQRRRLTPSVAAREFDIALVYRGDSSEAWESFCAGYHSGRESKTASAIAGIHATDLGKIRRPVEHAGIEPPDDCPEFIVRLCTFALRNDPGTIRALNERLRQVQFDNEPYARSRDAAVLACDCDDIHMPTRDAALRILFDAVQNLYAQKRFEEVCVVVKLAKLNLCGVLLGSMLAIIEGIECLSSAQLHAATDESLEKVLQGCGRLLGADIPQALALAAQHLSSVLQSSLSVPRHREVLSLMISTLLKISSLAQDWRALQPLVEILSSEAEKPELDKHGRALVQAGLAAAAAILKPGVEQTSAELDHAILLAAPFTELSVLVAQLLAMRRRRTDCSHPEYGDVHLLPQVISQMTRHALLTEDWIALAAGARRDLAALGGDDRTADVHLHLIGYLALALRMSVQFDLSESIGSANEALDLLANNAEYFMGAAPTAARASPRGRASMFGRHTIAAISQHLHPAQPETRRFGSDMWASSASELAMAAISLFRYLPEGSREFPVASIALLEKVLDSAPVHSNPVRHATCLHDLAHAYQQYAMCVSAEQRIDYLEHAASLFRESLVVYRSLRGVPEYLIAMHGRPAHVDYCNLGQVYLTLANEGSSLGPYASALYLREALCVLAMGRDIALETGHAPDATYAQTVLAGLATQLALACLEHTRANKGSLRREFQDWLCAIEGPVLSTWDFATRYASFALRQADSAIAMSARLRDEGLLHRSLRAAFEVWRVAELRHGVSGVPIRFDDNWWNMSALREQALLSIESALTRLSIDTEGLETLLPDVSDYRRYFAARACLALFDYAGRHAEDLLAATTHFDALCSTGGMIPRALSRPYADWFRVSRADDRIAANGLLLAMAEGGLEVNILAQRQAFVIGGLNVEALAIDTRESSWIKTHSVGAITGSYPQADWSGVPPVVPVVVGLCRCGARTLQILAVQIPTTSWNSWVLHLGSDEEGPLEVDLPFPVLGSGVSEHGNSTNQDSVRHRDSSAATLVGSALMVEVRLGRSSQQNGGTLEVTAERGQTRVRTTAAEITLAFRTTPTIVDARVAILAKRDSAFVGACGAAMFSLASPSPSIPSSLIRAYSSLYLFTDQIDAKIVDQLRNSSYRQLLVVGIPPSSVELDRLLETVFDPRREVHFLVSTMEVPAAMTAIARMHGSIQASFGSPLYSVARSLDEDFENATDIQVVEVERQLAPAAAQMLLDVAAFRHLPLEDIPTGSMEAPFPFQLLGDPIGRRRAMAALPNPATWANLTAKYVELMDDPSISTIGSTHSDAFNRLQALMTAPLARRPLLIVPADEASVVLACTPYARHLGAILLPDSTEAARFVAESKTAELYVVEGSAIAGNGQSTIVLPRSHIDIALDFCELAARDHESRAKPLLVKHRTDEVTSHLIAEMRPNAYVVVASVSKSEFWASALAANYAAALGSPLLLFDDDEFFSNDARAQSSVVLSGQRAREVAIAGSVRHLLPGNSTLSPSIATSSASTLERTLEQMNPSFVGVVSNKLTIPLEMIGDPPLGIRYAFGRLCAPDLTSLSLLISAAALREEVRRAPTVRVLVAEAGGAVEGRPLPGARREGIHLSNSLSRSTDLSVTFVSGTRDLRDFIAESREAAIIHFAGHGWYDDENPDESALVFVEGRLRAADVPSPLKGSPIVYSNACESGVGHVTEELRSWSGLAAAFIQSGAVNYIGSLWPIYDESSLRVAEQFYALLNVGYSTGEALRRAKFDAFQAGDPIWAALVQFGCPRNRLRSQAAKEAIDRASPSGDDRELGLEPDHSTKKIIPPKSARIQQVQSFREPSVPIGAEKANSLYLSARRSSSRGDWIGAERDIRLACELDSTEAKYVVEMCDYLCLQDKWSAALDLLLSKETQFSDSWLLHEALARVHDELGNYGDSCIAFQKVLACNPDEPTVVQARLGASYRKLGDFAAAEQHLRLSYAANPTSHLVNLFFLQWLKHRMLNFANQAQAEDLEAANEEAETVLQRALHAGILDADLLFIKAQLRLILGKPREALEILAVARRMNPEHPLVDRVYLPLKAEIDGEAPQ